MAVESSTSISSNFIDLSSHGVNLTTVLLDEWTNELGVELLSTSGHWKVEVQQEEPFCEPVDWEVASNNVGEEFEDVEQSEYGPVGQPLCIIFLVGRFDGFDAGKNVFERIAYYNHLRNVGRIEESSEVAK